MTTKDGPRSHYIIISVKPRIVKDFLSRSGAVGGASYPLGSGTNLQFRRTSKAKKQWASGSRFVSLNWFDCLVVRQVRIYKLFSHDWVAASKPKALGMVNAEATTNDAVKALASGMK